MESSLHRFPYIADQYFEAFVVLQAALCHLIYALLLTFSYVNIAIVVTVADSILVLCYLPGWQVTSVANSQRQQLYDRDMTPTSLLLTSVWSLIIVAKYYGKQAVLLCCTVIMLLLYSVLVDGFHHASTAFFN